jgi:hypothetical protein
MVIVGSCLYFRAAAQAQRNAGNVPSTRAALVAYAVLVSGVVTLALNVLGY